MHMHTHSRETCHTHVSALTYTKQCYACSRTQEQPQHCVFDTSTQCTALQTNDVWRLLLSFDEHSAPLGCQRPVLHRVRAGSFTGFLAECLTLMVGNQCSLETTGDTLMWADEKLQGPLMLHSCHIGFTMNTAEKKCSHQLLVCGVRTQEQRGTEESGHFKGRVQSTPMLMHKNRHTITSQIKSSIEIMSSALWCRIKAWPAWANKSRLQSRRGNTLVAEWLHRIADVARSPTFVACHTSSLPHFLSPSSLSQTV